MKLDPSLTDDAIVAELGQRLAARRLALGLTQAAVASRAGIGKRTLERLEAGEPAQLVTLIRVLRVLESLAGLNAVLPAPAQSPMALLRQRSGTPERRRQRARVKESPAVADWHWGDES